MCWPDSDVLESHICRLSSESLAAFVVDLWMARGFETSHKGTHIIASRGEETRFIYLLTGHATTPPTETPYSADIVITVGHPQAGAERATELGARLLHASDLAEMLHYAIDPDVAADLCESHFGASPEELRFRPWERIRRTVTEPDIGMMTAITVVSLLLAVGGGAVFGVVPGLDHNQFLDESSVTGETLTTASPDKSATSIAQNGTSSTEPGINESMTVPGVSETGISNANRLAEAHAGAVSDMSSYTIRFDYYASDNGSTDRAQYDVGVRVHGERSLVRTNRKQTGGTRQSLGTVYSNSSGRYAAENGNKSIKRLPDRTPTATPLAVPFRRPEAMVRTYLATPVSSVRVAETNATGAQYRLSGTGRPAGLSHRVTKYEMTALTDERGFVRVFEAEFSILYTNSNAGSGGRDRVRLTWTYNRLNDTQVRVAV
jgi:hypothetical protein